MINETEKRVAKEIKKYKCHTIEKRFRKSKKYEKIQSASGNCA